MILQRLSTGLTIPELMKAETDAAVAAWKIRHLDPALRNLSRRQRQAEMTLCLSAAGLVLQSTLLLVHLGLASPKTVVLGFKVSSHFSRAGLLLWRSNRRMLR